jgi:hypothetical protein
LSEDVPVCGIIEVAERAEIVDDPVEPSDPRQVADKLLNCPLWLHPQPRHEPLVLTAPRPKFTKLGTSSGIVCRLFRAALTPVTD